MQGFLIDVCAENRRTIQTHHWKVKIGKGASANTEDLRYLNGKTRGQKNVILVNVKHTKIE